MNRPDLTPILTISHHKPSIEERRGRGGSVGLDINGFGSCGSHSDTLPSTETLVGKQKLKDVKAYAGDEDG